jgi:hypothetical protein
MTRYNPTEGDELVNDRGTYVLKEDAEPGMIRVQRPAGDTFRTNISTLRKDLLHGRFTVKQD